jgi:carboxypeptidase C (cathepsin A)
MYSGYVEAGTPPGYPSGMMHMHYWLIESEGNPKTDPVVAWYNGGPGASSLFGLLVELGPLLLNDDSLQNPKFNQTGIPQLVRNPFAWSKIATIIAIDNPAPVGFSYCDPVGPTGDGTSCGPWNDSYVAKSNYNFWANWVKDFPEFTQNDFYIAGESYGGVYVPIIVRAILQNPIPGLNLKGFAVGDGCIGTEVLCGGTNGPYWDIEFMHGHGQVSNVLYNQIRTSCPEAELKHGKLSVQCQQLVNEMYTAIGGYYAYNLYDDCAGNIFLPSDDSYSQDYQNLIGGAVNDYACPGDAMNLWIARADVRRALNVPVNSYFFNGDNGVGFNYTLTEPNLLPFYKSSIANKNLRVLVYNGDTDPGINTFITQDIYYDYFTQNGISVTEKWRPWTLDGKKRMGGYITKFDQNFHYVTIRGSGHMVPEFKPAASLIILNSWLKGTTFPPYKP